MKREGFEKNDERTGGTPVFQAGREACAPRNVCNTTERRRPRLPGARASWPGKLKILSLLALALMFIFSGCFSDLSGKHFKCNHDHPTCPSGQACNFNTGWCEPLDALTDVHDITRDTDTDTATDTATDIDTTDIDTRDIHPDTRIDTTDTVTDADTVSDTDASDIHHDVPVDTTDADTASDTDTATDTATDTDADACTPSCNNKQCGPNGCGGTCGQCDTGKSCVNGKCVVPAVCGNGTCETDKGENCGNCTKDCICGVDDVCFNGKCCTPEKCNERVCGVYPNKCGGQVSCGKCGKNYACVDGKCQAQQYCGDGTCGQNENCQTCPSDCGDCCGNGTCEPDLGENCTSCAADCACGTGQTCFNNACCTPKTCDDQGWTCGMHQDGCGGQVKCGQCKPGLQCVNGQCIISPTCGNGTCDADQGETCLSCPFDCGQCCGNGKCEAQYGETCATCLADCGPCCGNGTCDPNYNETCNTCPADCGQCCGNGKCEADYNENCATCPADCGCGDGEVCVKTQCQPDTDNDGVPDSGFDKTCTGGQNQNCNDNCPGIANSDQEDQDNDGKGDACDPNPQLVITNPNDTDLADFQVKVDVTRLREQLGDNFNLVDKSDNPIKYCFAQEKGECNATPTDSIWVRAPLIPAKGAVTYQALPADTNQAAKGDEVFVFYDDFTESELDTDKWVCGLSGYFKCITYTLSNGQIETHLDNDDWGILATKNLLIKHQKTYIVEVRAKSANPDDWYILGIISSDPFQQRFAILDSDARYKGNLIGIQVRINGSGEIYPYQFTQPMNDNTWYHLRIIKKSPVKFEANFMDDNFNLIDSYETSHNEWSNVDWRIVQWKGRSTPDYWDYVLVRRWAPAIPTYTWKALDADRDNFVENWFGQTCANGSTAECDDNCPDAANADQKDSDGDGVGDACDCKPTDPTLPDCDGKECGPDGCGGSCGKCDTGHVCDSQGHCQCKYFDKTLGGSADDAAYDMKVTSDGGFILAGYTKSKGSGGADVWVVKLDAAGNVQWDRTFGGSGDDEAGGVVQTHDGGYAIAAYKTNASAQREAWIIRLDKDGNKVWDKTYGGNQVWDLPGQHIIETKTGDYVFAGYKMNSNEYGWIFAVDSSGNKIWGKTLGGDPLHSGFTNVIQTVDGGYAATGFRQNGTIHGLSDVWLVKFNADGGVKWQKMYDTNTNEGGIDLIETLDTDFLIVGNKAEDSNPDIWIIKVDKDGKQQWDNSFGSPGYDRMNSIEQTSDTGYIMAGFRNGTDWYTGHAWLIKLDKDGNKLWDRVFAGSGDDVPFAVHQMPDGGYVFAGFTTSKGSCGRDMWIVKTDANGNVQCP